MQQIINSSIKQLPILLERNVFKLCSHKYSVQINKNQRCDDPIIPTVLQEKDGEITIITLNRANKRNAINRQMAKELNEAITAFELDETSTVGVLHGSGGSFSSGYDMDELLVSNEIKLAKIFPQSESTRISFKKPIVGAISGYCIANAFELVLMCDLRVIEEDACLGFFNRRFGIPVLDSGTSRLPALIGLSRALDLILTGRALGAKEAFDIGLANRIVAPGTSLGQAVNLAKCIAKFPQAAVNLDRNKIYSQMFTNTTENSHSKLSNEIVKDIKLGIDIFKNGLGRGGKTQHIKEHSMADWELIEYNRELQKSKRNSKSQTDEID